MLTVLVQDQTVADSRVLADIVRTWGLCSSPGKCGVYIEGPPTQDMIHFGPECRGNILRVLFPERDLSPIAQVRVLQALVRRSWSADIVLGTHSRIVFQVVNQTLLVTPLLPVEAYSLNGQGELRSLLSAPPAERFLDESVLIPL